MNKSSLSQSVDICEVVFESVENRIADDHTECSELMKKLQKILGTEQFNDLETAIGYRVYKAQQAGFKVGWAMRGQV